MAEFYNEKSLMSKLIFKKYKIKKLISKGCYGKVYLGINIINKQLYAIKIEDSLIQNPLLKSEAYILYNIRGPGIPSVISYGHYGRYNILIQNLLGKSLENIWKENKQKLNLKDICMIAIQTLDRIEHVHSKNYLHRDIKPSNFLVGCPDNFQIYLIDFGNARKYRSSRTGKHVKSSKINRIFGTILFLPKNVLKGNEQSRKDDLESLGYMYIFLATGYLPWSNIKAKSVEELLQKAYEINEKTSIDILCKDMPREMHLYMKYVRNLSFTQKPDYDYLRSLFYEILFKNGERNDCLFSWVSKIEFTKKISNSKISKNSLITRLFKKITESSNIELIKHRNIFIDSPNNLSQIINIGKNLKDNANIMNNRLDKKEMRTDLNLNLEIIKNEVNRSQTPNKFDSNLKNIKSEKEICLNNPKNLEKTAKAIINEKKYIFNKTGQNLNNKMNNNSIIIINNNSQKKSTSVYNSEIIKKSDKKITNKNLNSHKDDNIFKDLKRDIHYKQKAFKTNKEAINCLKLDKINNIIFNKKFSSFFFNNIHYRRLQERININKNINIGKNILNKHHNFNIKNKSSQNVKYGDKKKNKNICVINNYENKYKNIFIKIENNRDISLIEPIIYYNTINNNDEK